MNEKAMELLKIFDLDGEAEQPASSLPYGKQRKLEIARALGNQSQAAAAGRACGWHEPQ